ncbi:MAG: transposase [Caldilineaceae bacterium]
MLQPRRPDYVQGGYYHIYNRGAHRQSIFRQTEDYTALLLLVKEYALKLQLAIIVYCLMPNHYHFLLRQDGPNQAGLLPQKVFNSYSKTFNRRYDHSGTLFEGPYKVKLIETDSHLLHLCRYIHASPVKDGIALAPELWLYSNYLEWIGERKGTLVDRPFIADHFPNPQQYVQFVQEYIATRKSTEEVEQYLKALEN